ncbi:D-alanyl-D-alanine endopeptidase [Nissabacter sp. SGAir0207]|uniref:D-alanyl-D-alanine endopeptidase n=1 Tax=Nissabacter sp. SGAir0207 TaxID=2126321 RepID=UPI001F0FD3E6|nr:D-alanyl-D-alanine endopeptidase [Nissabacter sp. SGAir0207]
MAPAVSASSNAAIEGKVTPLEIASGSAMVVDMQTHQVIYSRNPDEVVPIASITKLMTAMVTLDANQPLDEVIAVDIHNTPELRGVFSRVKVGSEASRQQMLHLALMSSENRAAATLAHHYPGGYDAFIRAMNAKARALGMTHTHYVEPTGLSVQNVSTARDLTKLLQATRLYPLISQLSTTEQAQAEFTHPRYSLPFRNTNHLLATGKWDIQLTKTGFTNQAGHCLAMRTIINRRPVTLVVLDAFGKYTHFADANRLRSWMETGRAAPVPQVAKNYRREKDQQLDHPTVAQAIE